MREYLLCLAVFLLVFGPQGVFAGDLLNQPWKVEADRITRGDREQEVIAEGNVVLERTGTPDTPMVIQADWIRYDTVTGIVEALGNVKLRSNTENADAEKAIIHLGEETAYLTDSTIFFVEKSVHFISREAYKKGEMTYLFKDGLFTTCIYEDDRRPAWSLSLKEADIDVDGFIFMKHSVLRIKDVPVLYLPFMAFPGRMNRQTGFLNPEISSSDRGGSGLMTPFFIDLSPSSDITLYPGYYADRGVMIGGEFRYIHDYGARFGIQATFLDDRLQDEVDDDYQDDGYLRTRSKRYWVRGKGDYEFGAHLKMLFDVDYASDRDFLMEFDDGLNGTDASHEALLTDFNRGLPEASLAWRQSSLQLAKNWSHAFLGAETTYVDDLNPSTTPGTTAIHTLPKLVTLGSLALPATQVNLSWAAEYVNYWRQEGVGMQRLDLHPRLTTPVPLGRWLEVVASGGMRHTLYQIESYDNALYSGETSPSRLAWDGDVAVSTTFQRDFAVSLASLNWLNHTIKPLVSYGYIDPDDDEEALPVLDSKDVLSAESAVGYGVENHFRIGGLGKDGETYDRYFGSLKINHSYDYRREVEPYGNLRFNLDIFPLQRLRVNYKTDLSVYGHGIVSYDVLARYRGDRGDYVAVDYRYNKNGDIHEVTGQGQVRLTETISLAAEVKQSLALDNVVSRSVSLIYEPGCWGMQVKFAESNDDKRFSVLFSLVALGKAFGLGYEDNLSADSSFTTSTDALSHDAF